MNGPFSSAQREAKSHVDSSVAEMIASGEIAIPTDFPPDRLSALLDDVHICRRRRLIHFIAQAIASDLIASDRSQEL